MQGEERRTFQSIPGITFVATGAQRYKIQNGKWVEIDLKALRLKKHNPAWFTPLNWMKNLQWK